MVQVITRRQGTIKELLVKEEVTAQVDGDESTCRLATAPDVLQNTARE